MKSSRPDVHGKFHGLPQLRFEDQQLTLAATDGRRLAVVSKDVEVSEENAGHLILPAKTVHEVERLLGKGDNVRIAFNDRQVAFEITSAEDSGVSASSGDRGTPPLWIFTG